MYDAGDPVVVASRSSIMYPAAGDSMRSTTRECECKSRKPSSPSSDLGIPAAAAVVLRQSSTAAAPGTCCDPRTRSCSAKQDAEDSANSQFSLSGEGEQRARDVDSRFGRAKKDALRCAGWQAQICGRSLARSAGLARSQTMEGFKLVRENVRQGSLVRSTKPLNPADITGSLFCRCGRWEI